MNNLEQAIQIATQAAYDLEAANNQHGKALKNLTYKHGVVIDSQFANWQESTLAINEARTNYKISLGNLDTALRNNAKGI